MVSIFQVAKWFLSKEPMANKKLQKLCYYAYSWYLALNYDPEEEKILPLLTEEKAEAWVHGPVFRKLYTDVMHSGGDAISSSNDIIDSEIIGLLNNVYSVYGGYTGYELENMSHQELPWIRAREGYGELTLSQKLLSDSDIIEEFLPRIAK